MLRNENLCEAPLGALKSGQAESVLLQARESSSEVAERL